MNYREKEEASKKYKEAYVEDLDKLIRSRQREAEMQRKVYIKDVFRDPERYRRDFREMLGWPLFGMEAPKEHPNVTAERIADEEKYSVSRMTLEIFEGVRVSGLYFEQKKEGERPLVIVQHGGLGTPELISGLYGSTANYNEMAPAVLARGADVFAPQFLLWDKKYGVPFDRALIDARLKRVGSSITAVEVYAIERIMDYFEGRPRISSFGMVGLSYGGFYTLFAAAADPRIRGAVSCSFFNSRDDHPWCDWTWQNAAYRFDDAEIACLVYPRRLWVEMGSRDELFDCNVTRESFRRVQEYASEVGTDWITYVEFDGVHEFCRDEGPLDGLIRLLEA